MTGGDAIVQGLLAHDIHTVFGLPGAQTYGLFDALQRAGIRVIGTRHEQACGYMAFGYARSTGRPAVFSVVPGPGVLNAGAALLTSLSGNEPVLCLTGQVPSEFLGHGYGHLHEMPDQLGTLRTIVKWADRIDDAAFAPGLIARAFQEMTSGRRGPAALETPWDVFTRVGAAAPCQPLKPLPAPAVDLDKIDEAAHALATAGAPMIFLGSGAIGAAEEIRELAELIEAPAVAFRSGRGIVSSAHPMGLSIAAAHRLWPQTDVAIGIGTRMEIPRWRWQQRPSGRKTIRVDIDPAEIRRSSPDIAVLADAKDAVRALLSAVRRIGVTRSDRARQIAEAKTAAEHEIRSVQPQLAYLDVLRTVLPADGMVTDEICQVGFASWYGFPVYEPRTFIASGYQGNLGSGFQTALGVKVAHPDKPVVAICGDGGFLFGAQELATAVQYGIAVVAVVFNNNAYGNVRRDQREGFGGRVVASDLVNPDFVKFAEAFGAAGAQVSSPESLQPVLERALSDGRPWIIEVKVPRDSEVSPWRFIIPP